VGAFRNNIAINIKSSGEGVESRVSVQDFGHTGDGFWFQGTGVSVVDNVVANAEGHAYIFFSRGLSFGGHKAQFLAANLPLPALAAGANSIQSDFVPIVEFR